MRYVARSIALEGGSVRLPGLFVAIKFRGPGPVLVPPAASQRIIETWRAHPGPTGLAPLDSSWQPARFFVINDRRLQANRVDHRSFAGFSLHNLGSGQQVAAGARRRGRRSAHRSAVKFSCSGGATMWCGASAWPGGRALRLQRRAAPTHAAHAAAAHERSPAHLRMMMSETPPPPSPSAGARSAHCIDRLEQREAHGVFNIPTTKRQRARYRRGHMQAPGRAAPSPSAPSAQREAATGLPQAPGRAAPTPSAPSA